jgi:hypothetical protein
MTDQWDVYATNNVLAEVLSERGAQERQWGSQSHPMGTSVERYAGVADISRSMCDIAARNGNLTWVKILTEEFYEALAEEDPDKLRIELLQVAAVCVQIVEDLDRKDRQ